MPPQNSCRVVVGRLMEIDIAAGYRTVDEIEAITRKMREHLEAAPPQTRFVIAADWRACRVLTQVVAERAAAMFLVGNPMIERSAILHAPDQATSVLQVMRLTQEAESPHRRVFTSPHEMERWLSEVLTHPEVERLRAMLYRRGSERGV